MQACTQAAEPEVQSGTETLAQLSTTLPLLHLV